MYASQFYFAIVLVLLVQSSFSFKFLSHRLMTSRQHTLQNDQEDAEATLSSKATGIPLSSPPKPSVLDGKFEVVSKPAAGLTEQKGAFDYGLLIAFPVMIGTLGFFFFFPYIAPQLAAQFPQ